MHHFDTDVVRGSSLRDVPVKLLLMAWARFEDEPLTARRREEIQEIRTDWGRVAYRFLRAD